MGEGGDGPKEKQGGDRGGRGSVDGKERENENEKGPGRKNQPSALV